MVLGVVRGANNCVETTNSKTFDHCWDVQETAYRQIHNIKRTLVGNMIVDRSDVVGASPVGAAPTISSFSTLQLAPMD